MTLVRVETGSGLYTCKISNPKKLMTMFLTWFCIEEYFTTVCLCRCFLENTQVSLQFVRERWMFKLSEIIMFLFFNKFFNKLGKLVILSHVCLHFMTQIQSCPFELLLKLSHNKHSNVQIQFAWRLNCRYQVFSQEQLAYEGKKSLWFIS